MFGNWKKLEESESYNDENEYLETYSSKEDDSDDYSYQEEFIKKLKSNAIHLEKSKDPPLEYHHGDGSFGYSQYAIDTNLLVICSFIALAVVMVTVVVVIFRHQNKTSLRQNIPLYRCIHAHPETDEDDVFCSIHGGNTSKNVGGTAVKLRGSKDYLGKKGNSRIITFIFVNIFFKFLLILGY